MASQSTNPIAPSHPVSVSTPTAIPAPSPYALVIQNYPGDFGIEFEIPVLEDKNLTLDSEIFADAQTGTNFRFSLEDALNAATRHLFIRDTNGKNHDNPEEIVEDWLNLLRWEVKTFWTVKPAANWYGETDNPEIYITAEHPRRAGEMLAEGIAILFAERRLQISRSKAFFYEGTGGRAKPDFVFRLKVKPKYGIVLTGRELYGLEVRSRAGIQSIHSADHKKLKAKKSRKGTKKMKSGQPLAAPVISGVLAVYCSYGPPSTKKKTTRSQIILGDPPEDQAVMANDINMAEILAVHYIGVTSRIGLWDEMHLLENALREIRAGRLPPMRPLPSNKRIRRVIPRRFGQMKYLGRLFTSLLTALHSGQLTKAEALSRFRRGNTGEFTFHGLNEQAINAINTLDFTSLEAFFDENAREGHRGATVGADGSIMMRIKPNAKDFARVEAELDTPEPGHDAILIDLDDE
jgi:hypothetical protein